MSNGAQYNLNGSNRIYLEADYAVDGLKQNWSMFGGQCASSLRGRTTEWRVDLGEILSINNISIQHDKTNRWQGTTSFITFILITCLNDTNHLYCHYVKPIMITKVLHFDFHGTMHFTVC